MRLTLRNIEVGTRSQAGGLGETSVRCWDEEDRRARYNAAPAACWTYPPRELE